MNSIQRRLTLTLAALCCLLWCAGSVAAYLAVRSGLLSEFDRAHTTDIDALSNMAEQSEQGLKFDSTGEYMPAFQREERPDYFQLWEPNGSTLYRSPALEGNLPLRAGTLTAPKFWNVTLPDGLPGRAVGVRFVPNEDEDTPRSPGAPPLTKEVTLVAAFHRHELDERLHHLGMVLLLVGASMAVATVLVVGLVVRGGLWPLSALAERVGTIDASSLQLRFANHNMPAELLPITEHLNDLLARLEASFARERRFSADVAHELRTPIAELRALAEVALKWPEEGGSAQGALKDALSIALQMESIATGLLALTRCEGSLLTVHPERVSIAAVIEQVYQPLAAKARDKQLAVSVDVPKDASWFTDPAAFRSILTNLLSNAVDHSPPATSVKLRAENNGTAERLLISNINRNLAVKDIPHLFERFWQKDGARSSPGHAGLGLALARAYAESLGMTLEAELKHPEIIFTLSDASSGNGAAPA